MHRDFHNILNIRADMNTFVLMVHSHLTQIPLRLPEKKNYSKENGKRKDEN